MLDPLTIEIGLIIAGSIISALSTPKRRDPQRSARDDILAAAYSRANKMRGRMERGAALYRAYTGRTPAQDGIEKQQPSVYDMYLQDTTQHLSSSQLYPLNRNESPQPIVEGGYDELHNAAKPAPVERKLTTTAPKPLYDVGQDDKEENAVGVGGRI